MPSLTLERIAKAKAESQLSPTQREALNYKAQGLTRRETAIEMSKKRQRPVTEQYVKMLWQAARRRERATMPSDLLAEYDKTASFRGVGSVRVRSLQDGSV